MSHHNAMEASQGILSNAIGLCSHKQQEKRNVNVHFCELN